MHSSERDALADDVVELCSRVIRFDTSNFGGGESRGERDAAQWVAATLANSPNPTMLSAGYKHNVIPGEATAALDGRILPGTETEFFETVDALPGPGISRTGEYDAPVSADHRSPDFAAMAEALRAHDPRALVLPHCMSGGTDAKAFARLGIPGYGFAPGRMPEGFDLWRYVHGVDEHVPTDSLAFGTEVLTTYVLSDPRDFAWRSRPRRCPRQTPPTPSWRRPS